LHVAVLTAYQYREHLPLVRALRAVLSSPARSATLATNPRIVSPVIRFVPAETAEVPEPTRATAHRPYIFVETDEQQPAATESPQETPFYSDRATLAANPENPTGVEGQLPYLDGSDERLWSTADVTVPRAGQVSVVPPRAARTQPGGAADEQPAAETTSPPITSPATTPASPPIAERGQQVAGVSEVTRFMEARRAEQEQKREQIRQWSRMGPGTESARDGVRAFESDVDPGAVAVTPPVGSADGRTLAARKSRLVAAGVSRQGVAAFNVAASPFGAYDKRLIQAVQSRWYALIERYGLYERAGQVTLRFELWEDGRVANLERKANTAGEMLALICEKAITDSAPFDPLPESLRVLLAGEPREVNFTFYY
ncbi:MAG: hypothetical protein N3A53_01125, partial [Verrucomicrobiae bacterium]|nr:hypothetical protein [Verrucomicrobiae bacterium]